LREEVRILDDDLDRMNWEALITEVKRLPAGKIFRKLTRPSDVLEILDEEEISGLCSHRTSSGREPKTRASSAQ
jgi:hypothetical protein